MKVVQDKNELLKSVSLFSNITDIYKITMALLGSLKENYELMEIAEEGQMPGIGSCFEALAKTAEFDVYIKYVPHILHDIFHVYKFFINYILLDTQEILIAQLIGNF